MKKILLVEDNESLLESMADLLEGDFEVITAVNGKIGLELAKAHQPDLIVSDIMMPEMDGYALVNRLKLNELTQEIPVILLTALGEEDNLVQGYDLGADDYIVKPFKSKVLISRIYNLLAARENLKKLYAKKQAEEVAPGYEVKDPTLALLESILVDRFRFRNVNIPDLARLMGITPSKLERDVKRLSGKTPLKYINDYRLEKAKYLLENTDMRVSDVSYTLGFKSLSYFGKCYRAKYGEAPSSVFSKDQK